MLVLLHLLFISRKENRLNYYSMKVLRLFWIRRILKVSCVFGVDKKRNNKELLRMREAICDTMKTEEFKKACAKRLGYTTNPWEIQVSRSARVSIGEPWVGNL